MLPPSNGTGASLAKMAVAGIKRMLAAAGLAIVVSGVAAAPASAGPEPRPRAGEWWLTTWKMLTHVWLLTEGAGVTMAVLDTGVQASAPGQEEHLPHADAGPGGAPAEYILLGADTSYRIPPYIPR